MDEIGGIGEYGGIFGMRFWGKSKEVWELDYLRDMWNFRILFLREGRIDYAAFSGEPDSDFFWGIRTYGKKIYTFVRVGSMGIN